MKINYLAIVGGILAFISLALPWWTMAISASMGVMTVSADVSVYLYQARASVMGFSVSFPMDLWYGWTAFALVIVGGVLAIVGSLTTFGKKLLVVGGVLALVSIIIFAVGLQMSLSTLSSIPGPLGLTGLSGVSLFSSGTINYSSGGVTIPMNYSTYLSFGFWLALVSAIVLFVAIRMHPKEEVAPPPPAPMQQQPPPEAPPLPGP